MVPSANAPALRHNGYSGDLALVQDKIDRLPLGCTERLEAIRALPAMAEDEGGVKKALTLIWILMGLSLNQTPDAAERVVLIREIQAHFGNMTAEELSTGFRLGLGGKLDYLPELNPGQVFSMGLVSKVMMSFQRYRAYQIKSKPVRTEPQRQDPMGPPLPPEIRHRRTVQGFEQQVNHVLDSRRPIDHLAFYEEVYYAMAYFRMVPEIELNEYNEPELDFDHKTVFYRFLEHVMALDIKQIGLKEAKARFEKNRYGDMALFYARKAICNDYFIKLYQQRHANQLQGLSPEVEADKQTNPIPKGGEPMREPGLQSQERTAPPRHRKPGRINGSAPGS